MKFPAFDARTPQGDSTAPPQRERAPRQVEDAEDMDDLLVPGVQKALNGARKAEARVARILRDRKKTEQQWQEYVRDSRAAYVKEHARYLKAVEICDRDLVEATEQQKNARLLLRHAAIQEELPASTAMETDDRGAAADWESLIAGWEQERALQDDAILRRAFLEREDRARELRPPSHQRAVSHPPQMSDANAGPMQATPADVDKRGQPPAYDNSSPRHPSARVDPYPVVSPGGFATPAPAEAALPAAAGDAHFTPGSSPVPPQARNAAESLRRGIKDASKTVPERPHVHGDIADKLMARRSAMEPFGRPPGLEAVLPAPTVAARIPAAHLLNDDLDELEETETMREGATELE